MDWLKRFDYKRNLGLVFVVAEAALMLIFTLRLSDHFYYDMAIRPGPCLWAGINPYDPLSPGACSSIPITYAPSAVMFFFQLFSYLPLKFGLAIYLLLSLFLFGKGMGKLWVALGQKRLLDLEFNRYRHLFWILVSFPLLDAILWAKIEMLQFGLILVAFSGLLLRKDLLKNAMLLGFVSFWNLQAVPIALLLMLVLFIQDFDLTSVIGYLMGTALSFFLPMLFFRPALFRDINQRWIEVLLDKTRLEWRQANQHIFHFIVDGLNVRLSLSEAAMISVLTGIFIAFYLLIWLWTRSTLRSEVRRSFALVLALGIGSSYISIFMPLSQSNSYLFYLPLVIAFLCYVAALSVEPPKVWTVLGLILFLVSVSRFIGPKTLRAYFTIIEIRAVGILVLMLIVIFLAEKMRRRYRPRR